MNIQAMAIVIFAVAYGPREIELSALTLPLQVTEGDIPMKPIGGKAMEVFLPYKMAASTNLRNVKNFYYTGCIEVGSPPQKARVLFDTGSADLWLSSPQICQLNSSYCVSHFTYEKNKSETCRLDGRKFSIHYLVGDIEGTVVQDDITVAGLRIKGQVFAAAHRLDANTMQFDFDGIMGLGLPPLSNIPAEPLFANMVHQRIVQQPVFAFHFSKHGNESQLSIGGLNHAHYKGAFTYAPVLTRNFWMIKLDKLLVDDDEMAVGVPATPDSGTTLLLGPQDIMDSINQAIGYPDEEGNVVLDCDGLNELPVVTFVINKKPFPLYPKDYVKETVQPDGSVMCWSAFTGAPSLKFVVLGVTFMQRYYTLFDVGKHRVGFATAT